MPPSRLIPFGTRGELRVPLEDLYFLTRQLHALQRAGVPLLSSLRALEQQLPSASVKRILRGVHQALLDGRTLSQALARYPRVFGPIYLGLVRVGEAGGLLEEVFHQLAQLYEWEIDLRRRLREALQYPIIVLLTLSIAVSIMVTFVLPRFGQLFESFRIKLPWQTRLLIWVSHALSRYGWLMALFLVGAVVGWCFYLRADAGRLRWHTWKLRLPVLGQVFLQVAMSRFARVVAALNRSGVPILETLALAGESVNNRHIQAHLDRVRHKVKEGGSLARAMQASPVFPPVVTQMVATGEESGRLDELLRSVSEYYDEQTAYTVRRLIMALEPLLLVVVGLGVLVMATAVFVPMWDLARVFKQGR